MIQKIIEKAIVDEIINPGTNKELFETIYVPKASDEALKFFYFMQSHIELESGGVGVSFRHNRNDLSKLLKEIDFEYILLEEFISDFENNCLKQYHENAENKQ